MVIESLINPFKAEQNPGKLFFYGYLYTSVALFLSMWIFREQASLVFVFFTVMGSIPLMYNVIKEEEKKDLQDYSEKILLKEHSKALTAFMALFGGITLATIAWYVYIPVGVGLGIGTLSYIIFKHDHEKRKKTESTWLKREKLIGIILATLVVAVLFGYGASQTYTSADYLDLFGQQIKTINGMGHDVTGYSTSSLKTFTNIFFNNIKVLIFCILFSFLYGVGAIFILTWNASVIGVAIGNYIRLNLAEIAQKIGWQKGMEYFSVISYGLLKYVIHGIPEILAYFVAALAGGIISVGVIRHDFKGRKFEHIILDAADLLILSIVILFIAAILEVWVTPLIFG